MGWIKVAIVITLTLLMPMGAEALGLGGGPVLPSPLSSASAVSDGFVSYIIGGYDASYLGQVLRYDPLTGTVSDLSITIPGGVAFGSAVWTGDAIVYFDVVGAWRIDPESGAVARAGWLPSYRWQTSAVWDGRETLECPQGCAYVFGGEYAGTYLQEILRYDPASQTFSKMRSELPSARWATAAAWTGSEAFVVGGNDPQLRTMSADVVRFDPVADEIEIVGLLPSRVAHHNALWTGAYLTVIGGRSPQCAYCTGSVIFEPTTGMSASGPDLEIGRLGAAATFDGITLNVFGGDTSSGTTATIERIIPLPSGP